MSLTVDSIFQPFNEFFLRNFDAGAGAPVKFRFSKFPRRFAASDFVVQQGPGSEPSKELAQEVFSNVVDRIPWLDPDGLHVLMDDWRLISDDLYDQILYQAEPFVPAGASDADKRVSAFNHLHAEANSPQYRPKLSSLMQGQQGKEYRPSNPTPLMWWRTDSDVWISHTFSITGADQDHALPIQDHAPPADSSDQILRLKIDNGGMRALLLPHIEDSLAQSSLSVLSRPTLLMAQPIFAAALSAGAEDPPPAVAKMEVASVAPRPAFAAMQMASVARPSVVDMTEVASVAAPPPADLDIHSNLVQQMSILPLNQRREIEVMLAQKEATQAVDSTDVSISFDFCRVDVARPWLHNGFLDNRDWIISGQPQGGLGGHSAIDGRGLTALPVAFVAIKNLRIHASWTQKDIENLTGGVQFGPFAINSNVVDGAITHDGIQIVGWMLQELPDLPPNAAP